MSSRRQWVLPLAAGVLLAAGVSVLWPRSRPEEPARQELRQAPAPARVAGPQPVAVEPVREARPEAAVEPAAAVSRPAEEWEGPRQHPEQGAAPHENDPVEPELPQTAAWRHGKVVRMVELLGRDVVRLEQEQQQAAARGEAEEAKRLGWMVARQRARVEELRQEAAALAEQARSEAQ